MIPKGRGPTELIVPRDCVARNRGADFVQHLAPPRSARRNKALDRTLRHTQASLRPPLYRSAESATKALGENALKALSKSERKGWQWLATRGKAKSGEYAEAIGVEPRTARRHLGHFEELGLVKKTGSGPSQSYEVK